MCARRVVASVQVTKERRLSEMLVGVPVSLVKLNRLVGSDECSSSSRAEDANTYIFCSWVLLCLDESAFHRDNSQEVRYRDLGIEVSGIRRSKSC